MSDVKKGVMFLEQLLASEILLVVATTGKINQVELFSGSKTDQAHKRDYLYYLAVGYTRMKDFTVARKYIKSLLQVANI